MNKEYMIISSIIDDIEFFLKKDGLELPKKGILAGQSLATLYLKKIGFSNYREHKEITINDIDVFQFQKNSNYYRTNSSFIEKEKRIQLIVNGYNIEAYSEPKYKIIDTKHNKSLNITTVMFLDNQEENELNLIEDFDINVTQIAFNLETRKLYLSDNFKLFLKTGQLKIVDISTPHHTAIRYVDKMYTHGFYGNVETELLKSKISITNSITRSNYFAEGYRKKFSKYRNILGKHFKLKKTKFFFKKEKRKLNVFNLETIFSQEDINKIGRNIFTSLHSNSQIIEYVDNILISKKNNINYNQELYKYLIDKYPFQHSHTLLHSLIFRDSSIKSKKNLEIIMNFCSLHNKLINFMFDVDVDEALRMTNLFKKIAKRFGIHYIGFIENLDMNRENFSILKLLRNAKKREKDMSEPFCDFKMFKTVNYNNYTVKELNSDLELHIEGKKMNNCVGGYGFSCKQGRVVIVSAEHDYDKSKRMTIEITFPEDNKDSFDIVQIKHVNNATVDFEDIQDILKTLKFAFIKENLSLKKEQAKRKIELFSQIVNLDVDIDVDIDEDEILF